jgi:membrane protein YdbS with pleckstrin-like domain
MSLIPPTRPWAGLGFFISSYIFGLTGWFMGLLLTWAIWGGVVVIIGLLFMGIGVVPLGMLATLFNGMWLELGLLTFVLILTFGLRTLGMTLAEKA